MGRFLLRLASPLAAALLPLLCGCGGGGGGGSDYRVTLDRTAVSFEADRNGPTPPAQAVQVTFAGEGLLIGYPPGVPAATQWLAASAPTTAQGNQISATLRVTGTGLVPGTYSTTLRFVTGKADGSAIVYVDLPVQFTLHDVPALSVPSLAFRTIAGAAEPPAAQGVALVLGSPTTAWQVETDQPWVHVDHAQGTGSGSLLVSVDPAGLEAGAHAATVRIRPVAGRVSVQVHVSLDCRPRRIWASRNGVALVSTPDATLLQKEIQLYDNAATGSTAWTASSDQAWLTAALPAADRLVLTADPKDLPEGLSYATVTVGSAAPKVENAEAIRVGLWRTSGATANGTLADLVPSSDHYGGRLATAVDPVRPWLYAVDTDGSTVRAYNVHSGGVEATFAPVVGHKFNSLSASSDGRWLFANSSTAPTMFRLDVDTGTWNAGFPYTAQTIGAIRMFSLRPEGRPMLLYGGTLLNAATGEQLAFNLFYDSYTILFPTEDQRHLVGTSRYDLDYDAGAKSLAATFRQGGTGGVDVAASRDGSHLYGGGNLTYGYGFWSLALGPDGKYALESTFPCPAYPNSVEVSDSGVFYAGRSPSSVPGTVTAYAPDGSELATRTVGDLLRGKKGLMLSGDGTRLLVVSATFAAGGKTSLQAYPAQ